MISFIIIYYCGWNYILKNVQSNIVFSFHMICNNICSIFILSFFIIFVFVFLIDLLLYFLFICFIIKTFFKFKMRKIYFYYMKQFILKEEEESIFFISIVTVCRKSWHVCASDTTYSSG